MIKSRLDDWISKKEGINPFTRSKLNEWQLNKLNEVIKYAKTYSGYYTYLPDHINNIEEFEKLPFITSDSIKNCPEDFVCVPQSKIARIVTMLSSGTTGEAKRLFYTREDQELTVDFFACGLSEIVQSGDTMLILMPCDKEGSVGRLIGCALERINVRPVYCGKGKTFYQMSEIIIKSKVNTIVGLPKVLLSLSRFMNGIKREVNIKGVLLSGDRCSKLEIDEINRLWNCEVFNHYGSTESGLGGAVECSLHNGMHIRENDLYLEVLNIKAGMRHCLVGEKGEIVLTTLTRNGMPIIRYRTGDITDYLGDGCECGSVTKRIGFVNRDNEKELIINIDKIIFSYVEILDYTICAKGDELILDLVTLKRINVKTLLERLRISIKKSVFKTIKINSKMYSLHNEKPSYFDKRKILS